MTKLSGVVPPVCTPLTTEGEVDVASYKRVIEHLITSGANGVFILGSSSEVAYLTDAQRRVVIDAAVSQVAGRVPVLVGVIDMTTPRVIEHALVAKELGGDAIVVVAPFYTRTSDVEIERHFRMVRSAVDIDVWAYDIPVCVHSKLERGMIKRLAADGVIMGLKDSSGDDANLRYLISEVRDDPAYVDFSILTGSELLVDTILWAGADGVVPGLGNVDVAGYVKLYAAATEGNWEEARSEQERLLGLFDIVNVGRVERMSRNASAIGAFKAGMYLQGLCDTWLVAAPQVPLEDAEVASVRENLVASGLSVTR